MDFGLFYDCQGHGVPEQIVLAEALGFGEWVATKVDGLE
jgi:hypothetical protein